MGRADVISFAPDRPWIAVGSRFAFLEATEARVGIWDYEQRRLLHSFADANGPLLWWETNSTVLAGINRAGTLLGGIRHGRADSSIPGGSLGAGGYYRSLLWCDCCPGVRGILDSREAKLSVFDPPMGGYSGSRRGPWDQARVCPLLYRPMGGCSGSRRGPSVQRHMCPLLYQQMGGSWRAVTAP